MAEEILDPHGDAPTFVIGLAMAGAVSAGAYTAGVLDTLFLALDAHQRRFEAGEVGYRVVLKAMSGSSAGGICAALGSMALIDGVRPIRPDEAAPTRPESAADLGHAPRHVGLPVLYDLWVRRINLLGKRSDDPARRDPEIDGLLSLSDLGPKGSNVHSVLDSTFIDAQAQALLRDCIVPDPSKTAGFVASDLEIFLTTTNLMGIPYEVRFSGEDSPGHLMASHGAVTHFSLHGVGSAQVSSEWLDIWDDPGTPVDVTAFDGRAVDFSGETASDTVWKSLLDTAVASGAFPVGLASRQLVMEPVDLHQRAWPVDANPDIRPIVRLSGRIERAHSLPYVAVDGGVANNEPFELARFALRPSLKKTRQAAADREKDPEAARLLRDRANETPDWQLAPNPRAANEADRAVIMIDPFPEGPELAAAETEDSPQRSIEASVLFAAKRLLPSLINQARFKPTELMNATDDSIHSRFLVAPSRTLTSKREIIEVLVKEDVSVEAQPERLPEKLKMSGAAAIASGFLGGFGGFFSEFFREHDYRLGQKNCRSFLENYFVLAPDNPLFEGSEDLRRPVRGGAGRSGMVRILQFDGGELPDMTRRFTDPHQLPALKDAVLSDTVKHIRRRIERAGLRLVEGAEMGWFPKLLIDQAWNGVGWPKWKWRATNGLRESVAQRMERTLLADLTARRQSERSEGMTDAQRALYVGLLRQHGKPASAEAIAEASTIIPSLDVAAMSALAPGESRNAKAFRLRSKLEVLRQMRANDELTGKTHLRIRKKTPPGGDSPSEYVLAE